MFLSTCSLVKGSEGLERKYLVLAHHGAAKTGRGGVDDFSGRLPVPPRPQPGPKAACRSLGKTAQPFVPIEAPLSSPQIASLPFPQHMPALGAWNQRGSSDPTRAGGCRARPARGAPPLGLRQGPEPGFSPSLGRLPSSLLWVQRGLVLPMLGKAGDHHCLQPIPERDAQGLGKSKGIPFTRNTRARDHARSPGASRALAHTPALCSPQPESGHFGKTWVDSPRDRLRSDGPGPTQR